MIELGPHSAMELPIKQTKAKLNIKETDAHYSPALSRGKNAVTCVLNMVGNLYFHGHDIDFTRVNYVEPSTTELASQFSPGPQGKVLPDLPSYAWTYDALLWNESRHSIEYRNRKYPHHDLQCVAISLFPSLKLHQKR
jgi:acyl transferase domain-containing protein